MFMEINIDGKKIISTPVSQWEEAWPMADADTVLAYMQRENRIVLGGDILTKDLEYSYDNWCYTNKLGADWGYDVEHSVRQASDYISNYIKLNGNQFYVIYVTRGRGGRLPDHILRGK